MHYNTNSFGIATKILQTNGNTVKASKLPDFLPQFVDLMNSSLTAGTITVTHDAKPLFVMVSPKIAEPALQAAGEIKVGETDTTAMRTVFGKNPFAAVDGDVIQMRRGGGYSQGPVVGYLMRPGFFQTLTDAPSVGTGGPGA